MVVESDDIRRSSHVVAVVDSELLIFGGEIKPRQPVDNKVYRISPQSSPNDAHNFDILESRSTPTPRVGSASTVLHGKVYFFSGRGGEAMAPIEEHGALQVFDPQKNEWSSLPTVDSSADYPPARSYHAMTTDNTKLIFIHAGCPVKDRLSDLWSFDIESRKWKQHADAPGPARGGTSIAWLNGKIYRMNGFDGKHEQGFALDIYDLSSDSWSTRTWNVESGPSARSVSTLLTVRVDDKDMLVTMFGECDPSNLGHMGAGRFLDDVWAYDIAHDTWSKVAAGGNESSPRPRGWFAADVSSDRRSVVIQGGLAEDNTRIGDAWTLTF